MNKTLVKETLIKKLKEQKLKLCVAESITGGKFVYEFVKRKGASSFIDYSLVCYSNDSKVMFLGLEEELKKNDVVSEIIVKKMAINITKYSKLKNTIGLSSTGLASNDKRYISKMKTGTVFFAVYYKNKVVAKKKKFENLTREKIISQTVNEMIILCNSVI